MNPTRLSAIGIHAALLVIIIGGLVSWFTGTDGNIYLGVGAGRAATWRAADGAVLPLPFSIGIDSSAPQAVGVTTVSNGVERHHSLRCGRKLSVQGYDFVVGSRQADVVCLIVNRDPDGRAIVYAGFALLLIAMGGYFLSIGHRLRRGRRFVWLPPALGAVAALVALYKSSTGTLSPILDHPLLAIHIGLVMTAYSYFALVAVLALVALAGRRAKDTDLMPLVAYGEWALAAGIAVGSVWAAEAWGSYWSWDPKETWALITLLVYALPFHVRVLRQGRAACIYFVAAIICVVFTWFGVPELFGGLHSYS